MTIKSDHRHRLGVSGDFCWAARTAYEQRRRHLPRSALFLPPPPSWLSVVGFLPWPSSHYYPYLGMSSFFKRHQVVDEPDTDEENDDTIDPELRLRTVRTAASAIAESIKSEQRAERRKTMHKRSRFFRRHAPEKKPTPAPPESTSSTLKAPGPRRNVYVNHPLSAMEVDHDGEPKARYVRNKVRTTSE